MFEFFLEKFAFPVLAAAFVVIAIANPMKWSNEDRVYGVIISLIITLLSFHIYNAKKYKRPFFPMIIQRHVALCSIITGIVFGGSAVWIIMWFVYENEIDGLRANLLTEKNNYEALSHKERSLQETVVKNIDDCKNTTESLQQKLSEESSASARSAQLYKGCIEESKSKSDGAEQQYNVCVKDYNALLGKYNKIIKHDEVAPLSPLPDSVPIAIGQQYNIGDSAYVLISGVYGSTIHFYSDLLGDNIVSIEENMPASFSFHGKPYYIFFRNKGSILLTIKAGDVPDDLKIDKIITPTASNTILDHVPVAVGQGYKLFASGDKSTVYLTSIDGQSLYIHGRVLGTQYRSYFTDDDPITKIKVFSGKPIDFSYDGRRYSLTFFVDNNDVFMTLRTS